MKSSSAMSESFWGFSDFCESDKFEGAERLLSSCDYSDWLSSDYCDDYD